MSIWTDIYELAKHGAFGRLQNVVEQSEEFRTAIAAAVADRLTGAKGPEIKARSRKAKYALQSEHNPLGGTASLAQALRDRIKSRNTLLRKHGKSLAEAAPILIELFITSAQIDDIERAQREVESSAHSKQTKGLKGHERVFIDRLQAAGCTLWQLRQLSEPDLAYIAAFAREKAADPHHCNPDGIAAAAYRAGFLELNIEGLNADEKLTVLMAAGIVTESEFAAKASLEEAAGKPLDISPTLAAALKRAAETYGIAGIWPGSTRTIDYAYDEQVERDLRTILELLGIDAEQDEHRGWSILIPRLSSPEPIAQPAPGIEEKSAHPFMEAARHMLEYVHGTEFDRWEEIMSHVGEREKEQASFWMPPSALDNPRVRKNWRDIVLAERWQDELHAAQDAEVEEMAQLLRDREEMRWFAAMINIDLPSGVTVEPPFQRAAELLCQSVEEIVWSLFDPPQISPNASKPIRDETTARIYRDVSDLENDYDY